MKILKLASSCRAFCLHFIVCWKTAVENSNLIADWDIKSLSHGDICLNHSYNYFLGGSELY